MEETVTRGRPECCCLPRVDSVSCLCTWQHADRDRDGVAAGDRAAWLAAL